MSTEQLFRVLLVRAEKKLIPIGVWPTPWNWWVTLFNIIILFVYAIFVLIKNLLNPERESIENAFTLVFGGLINFVYFLTFFLKKEKFLELFEFVKNNQKFITTSEERKILINVGKEFQRIVTAFSYFLPSAVLVRFLIPIVEFTYIKVRRQIRSSDAKKKFFS